MKSPSPPNLLIFNPIAGNGRAKEHWPLVERALLEQEIKFDVAATSAPLEARELAQQAPQKYSQIIAIGGDGTIHEIVNGLMRASGENETIPLGIVPLGNGDDFAKMIPPETPIGSRPFDWNTAVQKIARGQTKLFDVGRISGDHLRPELGSGPYYFMNSFDVGFGAKAAQNLTTIPTYFKGLSAYLASIIKTLIDFPALDLRLQLDDQLPFEQPTTITAVMNGRCLGNGFWFCPDARADDGVFDLMVSQKVGRFTILRMIPKLMRGTHVNEPIVSMYRAQRVMIESKEPITVETDGEIPYLEAHRLEIKVLHKRLRVIV
jgi:YegS/Rv2252/BmrU family lipid kinase